MKCTYHKCSTGLPGRWQPVLLLWPEGYKVMQCQPVSVTCNKHMICDGCKDFLTAQILIPIQDFKVIQRTVVGHGKNRPAWKTAKLEFFVEDSFGDKLPGEVKIHA